MEPDSKETALVSVLMPSYQAEAFLAEAIESVLKQTYPYWELLILDDASRDASAKIARAYAERDPRIRFYQNPENLGVARTRNRGIALARGQWIALLDSDDRWYPEKLETQLRLARESGAELLYSSYALWNEETGEKRPYLVPPTVDYRGLLAENVIGCSTVLLRASLLGAEPFSEQIYHEDYALWLSLLRSGIRAAGCTKVLTDWRISINSRSFSKWNAARQRWIIYRQAEKLSLPESLRAFAVYCLRGIRKHKRIT